MIVSMLSSLDSDLRGFKDQILASKTIPAVANAYSCLLHSSLDQSTIVGTTCSTPLKSSVLISSSTQRGGYHGNSRDGSRRRNSIRGAS